MTYPNSEHLFEVLDCTWPAARFETVGPWCLRHGDGGGQRVSAATLVGDLQPDSIDIADQGMKALGQRPLFMIRSEDVALDEALESRAFDVVDPVCMYVGSVEDLEAELPITAAIPSWPPLAVQLEIWQKGGIGPARVRVMDRSAEAKVTILGRTGDVPAGTAFVACHKDVAMVHAIEVEEALRRQGVARNMLHASANWAASIGAKWISLAVTRSNGPANALYRDLGMQEIARYHYRRSPSEST